MHCARSRGISWYLCDELKYLDNLVDKVEILTDSIETVVRHLKNVDIELSDQAFTKDLLNIANIYINFINLVIRQLQGSISFLSKAKNIVRPTKSSVKTENEIFEIMNK